MARCVFEQKDLGKINLGFHGEPPQNDQIKVRPLRTSFVLSPKTKLSFCPFTLITTFDLYVTMF